MKITEILFLSMLIVMFSLSARSGEVSVQCDDNTLLIDISVEQAEVCELDLGITLSDELSELRETLETSQSFEFSVNDERVQIQADLSCDSNNSSSRSSKNLILGAGSCNGFSNANVDNDNNNNREENKPHQRNESTCRRAVIKQQQQLEVLIDHLRGFGLIH